MSVRRQSKNVSFSSFDEGVSFSHIRLNTQRPLHSLSPLNNSLSKPNEMERQNIAPNTLSPLKGIHTVEYLEEEVKRLSDMVFYLGTSKDKLIIQNDEQQKQISYLKICEEKFKEEYQAEVRKLKELLNDKNSECQSLIKNSKREKDILEKQNERIKTYIKSIIEQKNEEIFKMNQDKAKQTLEIRVNLEQIIEDLKKQQKEESEKIQNQIVKLQEEIQFLKNKNEKLEKEYLELNDQSQSNLLKIGQEHEGDISELAQKYHRNKLLMLRTSQQELQIMQQSSQIQRQAYLFEIESLKRQIERLQVQNDSIKERQSLAEINFEQNLQDYQVLVSQLKQKLNKIHKSKEQELELTKIKVSVFHEDNLKAIQETYIPRLQFLSDKIQDFEEQIQHLHEVLSTQIEKNASLARKLHLKESKHHQQMAKMKLMYDSAEQILRQKFFSEKSVIIQKSAQLIKNYQMKTNSIQFYQEELRKLRKQLEQRISESEDKENTYDEEKRLWEAEREQLLQNIKTINQNSEKVVRELKGLIDDKSSEIDNLSKQILKSIRESPLPDYNKYLQQIDILRKEGRQKDEVIKIGKDKVERAEKKCREYQEEVEKLRLEGDLIINEAKGEWQVLSQEKINELEDFYKKKLEFLEDERDELKELNKELEEKINQLVVRYRQLQYALNEMMASLQRRSEFDQKLILLGTDVNLVKNKDNLFDNEK